jgi:hypothetical protein
VLVDTQDELAPEAQHPVFYRTWWFKVLVVFALSRVATTIILLIMANAQGPNPWTGAHPGYFDFANIWDGLWYNIVGASGYPSHLPVDAHGQVTQNTWAFLPAYPAVVNVVAFITRLPWSVASVLVSVGFGAGASLVFYRLLRITLDESASLFAVVLFCVAPVSPLMQLGYAESMYAFLLALGLYLLVKRRYWMLLPVVTVMAFTRPSGAAFALTLGLHVVYRWVLRRRDPFPVAERVASVTVTLFSGIAAFAWPAIAAIATGNLNAYTDTELSWRSAYIGVTRLVPFTSWFEGATWWFNTWLGLPVWLGIVALFALIALFIVVMFTRPVVRLGVDVRFWLASYAVYLFAVFFPQSSTFRLLMPMFPMLGAVAQPRSRLYRVVLVVLFLAAQVGWLLICWGVDGYDWTPP